MRDIQTEGGTGCVQMATPLSFLLAVLSPLRETHREPVECWEVA